MPRLMITSLEGQENCESFDLKLGVNRLGRTSENDMPIEHPTVSTLHCHVVWMNDSVVIRDCDSTNGTFIDGERINTGQLEPGQVLRVGAVELMLDSALAAISVPDLSSPEPVAQPTPPPGTLPCDKHPTVAARFHCPSA
jgi:pSer/pThr/pTyr-binding forkhead associated (FHA) protein